MEVTKSAHGGQCGVRSAFLAGRSLDRLPLVGVGLLARSAGECDSLGFWGTENGLLESEVRRWKERGFVAN